jgi:hypothetical protein
MIGSEEWCSGCVTRRRSRMRHQFIGIDHGATNLGKVELTMVSG